jgi:hypothetical protein
MVPFTGKHLVSHASDHRHEVGDVQATPLLPPGREYRKYKATFHARLFQPLFSETFPPTACAHPVPPSRPPAGARAWARPARPGPHPLESAPPWSTLGAPRHREPSPSRSRTLAAGQPSCGLRPRRLLAPGDGQQTTACGERSEQGPVSCEPDPGVPRTPIGSPHLPGGAGMGAS